MSQPLLTERHGFTIMGDLLCEDGKPFSGYVENEYDNGQLESITQYSQGKKHGIVKSYYPSGRLKTASLYKSGNLNGEHTVWWENGIRKFTINYSEGQLNGPCEERFSHGRVRSKWHFLKGKKCIFFKQWDEQGNLLEFIRNQGAEAPMLPSSALLQ